MSGSLVPSPGVSPLYRVVRLTADAPSLCVVAIRRETFARIPETFRREREGVWPLVEEVLLAAGRLFEAGVEVAGGGREGGRDRGTERLRDGETEGRRD